MVYVGDFVIGDNQVNQEKPLLRVCSRCNSNNTKFCYYNNYTVSQPPCNCKDCLRHWTHGGALRNQVSCRHQPFLHGQESNQFVGSFGGPCSCSSSCIAIGNQIGCFPEIHGDMVRPFQSFSPMDRFYFHEGLFQQDYYNVESNDLIGNHLNNQSIGNHLNNQSIGNHLINQSIGSYNVLSSDHNSYINQEDQNKWNQSFNNTMNMNHNASTSGSRVSLDTDQMKKTNINIKNNCVYKSSYHLEEHGP